MDVIALLTFISRYSSYLYPHTPSPNFTAGLKFWGLKFLLFQILGNIRIMFYTYRKEKEYFEF